MITEIKLIVITTTSDDRDELESIARHLVESKLAACCQISGPITSFYTWQGKTESTAEWTCTIKTQAKLFQRVKAEIMRLHHYDVPQIVGVEVSNSSASYRQWVSETTGG
jgi:periplasmic divalent cation tolerance protein